MLIRWRGWVIAAWAVLALLFAPRAIDVQDVLALRGGASETTEAARASELLKQAFPGPFADYVAIVVHGPVRWTNQRFGVVLDTLKAGAERAVPATLVVLVVAFGALVAAMLPVIVGVLAITIALGLVTVAARYLPMSVFVLNITTMVGLGVGIDYSLLIVTRFREELNRGLSPVDAAVRTIETAGSAVI